MLIQTTSSLSQPHLSKCPAKGTSRQVCPSKTQISLSIPTVWSVFEWCSMGSQGSNISSGRRLRLWLDCVKCSGPEVIKLFLCSIQVSIIFRLLIKTETLKKRVVSHAFKLSYDIFIMLINVKMPTIVGILTFMSRINFVLSWVEYG